MKLDYFSFVMATLAKLKPITANVNKYCIKILLLYPLSKRIVLGSITSAFTDISLDSKQFWSWHLRAAWNVKYDTPQCKISCSKRVMNIKKSVVKLLVIEWSHRVSIGYTFIKMTFTMASSAHGARLSIQTCWEERCPKASKFTSKYFALVTSLRLKKLSEKITEKRLRLTLLRIPLG